MKRIQQICLNAEKHRQLIFDAHDYIWNHAESGFREWETSRYLECAFEKLGYTLKKAGNIPGFYTDVDTGRPGPKVLILGELDALIIPSHPESRSDTNCVHACGHHAQAAALLGIAAALKEPDALKGLCGSIRLMAVPAEELTEIDYREELRQTGVIRYFGGKQEFLARGYMDGCDLAFMVHTGYGMEKKKFGAPNRGDNGCVIKTARFSGRSAHVGNSPHLMVNALAAMNLAINNINALRETFLEKDYVRIQIDYAGGDMVSGVIQMKIRASTMEVIHRINQQVNRALACGAAAVGATVAISDRMGYSPLRNDPSLSELFCKAAALLDPEHPVRPGTSWSAACTDLGDLSGLMPVVHPYCKGAAKRAHTENYRIGSVEMACVNSAKLQLVMLQLLLENDAAAAKEILKNYVPVYKSKAAYLAELDLLMSDKEAVSVCEDGTLTLSF